MIKGNSEKLASSRNLSSGKTFLYKNNYGGENLTRQRLVVVADQKSTVDDDVDSPPVNVQSTRRFPTKLATVSRDLEDIRPFPCPPPSFFLLVIVFLFVFRANLTK